MKELLKQGYTGNPQQVCTLRRVTIAEGKAKGTEIIEVKTAGGLELDILPDAGLDIGQARFKGVNVSWMSKNGYDSPAVIAPYETEFVNTFPGGLLYTCGLRSAGPANREGIKAITVSSFGESFVAIDESGEALDEIRMYFGNSESAAFDALVEKVGEKWFMEICRSLLYSLFFSAAAAKVFLN